MDQCFSYLANYGLEEEGILRISSGDYERRALRKEYDEGHQVSPLSHSIHCVASVLKEFFRELEKPIIPFENYQSFVDLYSSSLDESQDLDEGDEMKSVISAEGLKNLVESLPDRNQKVRLSFLKFYKNSTIGRVAKWLNAVDLSSIPSGSWVRIPPLPIFLFFIYFFFKFFFRDFFF